MSAGQETKIEGSPSQIESLATFLRSTGAEASDDLALAVTGAKGASQDHWTGATGGAMRARLGDTASAATGMADQLPRIATALDALAEGLRGAQSKMSSARTVARSGGLTVTGTTVAHPDALMAGRSADEQQSLVDAWEEVVTLAEQAYQTWIDAIAASSYRLTATRSFHLDNAARLMDHVDALSPESRVATTPDHLYELLDGASESRRLAGEADDLLSKGIKVGSKLGKGLEVLGFAATGYAIYDDIESGESVEQAVTSNVGGMAAGMLAGAGAGAIVGSFIVPPAGTVVGAVVGTIVGAGVGMFTSGVIDHLWEDASAGFADTVEAGWNEIADTGKAVGDLATGVWDAVFG
ncbi:MAG: hypothetical protein ACK5IM_07490 [Demequina sp.]|uniref:hypothetical protein n=1 Tax=Demequina sp. TaxID=2050685 RepID=UPI003A890EEB